ncbi:phosphohydrolase [Paenibacillus baekrokdamisoli]|uniref:Phosphohydrolase n=1 Tax=Paenibacillus baekrokdamisoli TaxID=1712516 RepID=A0A3G9J3B2_9BACL|nr:pyridoxamine 5'-phosphate oxidase family protein [Paenibacillus baekrokdamisoli]MBB3068111.1 hypothetical protein [Paenibacillus baekrokdamisoli]BBH22845.1 phosphohydrolase [Paenibacillus baekrokdamisoli]
MSSAKFKHIVHTEEELRELLGYPSELVKQKAIDYIDQHCRDYIAKTPLLFIGTTDEHGLCDVSPRGDAAGFVLVLDEKHLVIPERPGNRRWDTLLNLMSNGRIGLIFLIPGLEETLRINGQAYVIRDQDILEQMTAYGKEPLIGIGVEVEECYIHCAKAFKRSKVWNAETWIEPDSRPVASKILAAHVNQAGITETDIEQSLKESYEKRLY